MALILYKARTTLFVISTIMEAFKSAKNLEHWVRM